MRIIIILSCIFLSCTAQNTNTENMETYNFELMSNTEHDPVGVIRNGWKIIMYSMTNTGSFYNEYPHAPRFDKVVKLFHPNGRIKYIGKIVGEYLAIGESIYYDEDGNITKVDEDKKFSKIKLDDRYKRIGRC